MTVHLDDNIPTAEQLAVLSRLGEAEVEVVAATVVAARDAATAAVAAIGDMIVVNGADGEAEVEVLSKLLLGVHWKSVIDPTVAAAQGAEADPEIETDALLLQLLSLALIVIGAGSGVSAVPEVEVEVEVEVEAELELAMTARNACPVMEGVEARHAAQEVQVVVAVMAAIRAISMRRARKQM